MPKRKPSRAADKLRPIVGPDPLSSFGPTDDLALTVREMYAAFLRYVHDAGGSVTDIHGISFVRPAPLVTGKGGKDSWCCCITASGDEPEFVRNERRSNNGSSGGEAVR